jgi:hypothetical protein
MHIDLKWTARLGAALSLTMFAACPDKGAGTDSATGTGTTTGDGPTTGMTAPTTGTTGGETEGEACGLDAAALEQACTEVCANYDTCGDVDPAACVESCETEAFKDTPACLCGTVAWASCRAELDCDGLAMAGFNAGTPCFAEGATYLVACGDCHAETQFLAPTACAAIVECPDVLALGFTCSEGTCTCSDGDNAYKTCPDAGLCGAMDGAALQAAATECCGVPF